MSHPNRFRFLTAALFFFILLSAYSPTQAIDMLIVTSPDPLRQDWRWTAYDRRSGLAGKIYTMCEDRDGNIWFGTNRGVQKYDGLTWTTYTTKEGLTHNYVSHIMQAQFSRCSKLAQIYSQEMGNDQRERVELYSKDSSRIQRGMIILLKRSAVQNRHLISSAHTCENSAFQVLQS